LLDGAYDQTIRAGNTNAETIRVSIDALSTASTAKLANYAVEKATATVASTAADAITLTAAVAAAGQVQIDTFSLSDATFKDKFKTDSLGEFTLGASGIHAQYDIDAKTGKLTSKAAVTDVGGSDGALTVTYAARTGSGVANHVFTINLTVSAGQTSNLSGIEVETTVKSSYAIETLDKALEEVSSAQAKLGAIQNRLQHNIDNLSKSAMLTEQSVGRVTDADFATETSNLSKQQILNQAATAMLAQANQSKQSVLSLLQ
jgi:flagellin